MSVKRVVKNIIKAFIPYGFILLYRKIKKYKYIYKLGGGIIPENLTDSIYDKVLLLKHEFAYNFASKYIKTGMRVLDYGCGDGYGAAFFAKFCSDAQIVGTDADRKVLQNAQNKYKKENLEFLDIDKIGNKFDMIVSFQVIEHIPDVKKYLRFFMEIINENGIIILSTPDRIYRLTDGQNPWNAFHLREYDRQGFTCEIKSVFPDAQIYQLTGEKGLLRIEYQRCRNARNDKKIYGEIEPTVEDINKMYTIDDFYLSSEHTNDSLDLYAVIKK